MRSFRRSTASTGRRTSRTTATSCTCPSPSPRGARAGGWTEAELRLRASSRGARALLAARATGAKRPLVDDKVLDRLERPDDRRHGARRGAARRAALPDAAARRAADFVLATSRAGVRHAASRLPRGGRAHVAAFLDDYAFLIEGLLRLARRDRRERWTWTRPCGCKPSRTRRLGDAEAGGYFAAGDDPRLLFRAKPAFDGAVASGNGIAVLEPDRAGRRTGEGSLPRARRGDARCLRGGHGGGPARATSRFCARCRAPRGRRPRRGRPAAAPAKAAPPPPSAPRPLEDEAREAVAVEAPPGERRSGRLAAVHASSSRSARAGTSTPIPPAPAPRPDHGRGRPRAAAERSATPKASRWPAGPSAIPVYRGQVRRSTGEIDHRGGGAPAVELTYQACDDARCLPPVTRLVRLQ